MSNYVCFPDQLSIRRCPTVCCPDQLSNGGCAIFPLTRSRMFGFYHFTLCVVLTNYRISTLLACPKTKDYANIGSVKYVNFSITCHSKERGTKQIVVLWTMWLAFRSIRTWFRSIRTRHTPKLAWGLCATTTARDANKKCNYEKTK